MEYSRKDFEKMDIKQLRRLIGGVLAGSEYKIAALVYNERRCKGEDK